MDKQSADYKKLRWRTRRGMLELDMLLEPFFEEAFLNLPKQQQHTFVELLDCEDAELLDWFNGKSKPGNEQIVAMVEMIRAHARRPT